MGELLTFPSLGDRDWRVWEQAIRSEYQGGPEELDAVESALPAIREHWEVIFESVNIDVPPQSVPGRLTPAQGKAIQAIIDASANAVVSRLKHERHVSLGRLIRAEIELSKTRLR